MTNNNRTSDNDSVTPSVDKVSVKVPPFSASDPELWFLMLESSFDVAGIVRDDTKYGYALSGLDQKYAFEIRDVIAKPRSERSYELLRAKLIKHLGSSQEQNTRRLLENEQLGDRKPSQFLRHLRSLAGNNFPDEILQTLWIGRLPKHLQAMLAAHKNLSVDVRAEIADSVAEVYGPMGNISETSTAGSTASINTRMDYLETALTTAMQELAAIKINCQSPREERNSRSTTRFRSRSRSRHNSRNRSAVTNEMCWYHRRFGVRAEKCDKPCKFVGNPSGNETGSC